MDKKRKKIGLKVSQSLGVNAHGAETHTVVEFIKYLSVNYDVDLIGCEIYPNELGQHKIFTFFKYGHFPKIIRKFLHIPISILNTLVYTYKEKPDLLFIAGGVFYNGLAVLIASKIFGVTNIIRTAEDHFNYYKYCENLNCKIKHYLITNLVSKFVLKSSDYVLTVGEKSKQYFIENGIQKNKIFGIPGPISQEDFVVNTPKEDLRAELQLPIDKTIVLYVGAISGVKGTNDLPLIIEQTLALNENFFFCIIGSETNGTAITKAIQKAGQEACTFIHPQPHHILKKYFAASDVLVFLTKVGVGYGQITIEASLSGLPVVAFNPGLDVEWFLKDNCHRSINDIITALSTHNYTRTQIPKEFDKEYIANEHLKMFATILERDHENFI